MSDLQCPARILLVCHGPDGLPDADAAATALRGERPAAVLSPDEPVSTAVATEVAQPTGAPVRPLEPLDDVADSYRGEAVVVVVPAAALAGLLADIVVPQRDAAAGEILVVEGDADGWRWAAPLGGAGSRDTA